MRLDQRVAGTIGPEDQQAGRVGTPGDRGEPLQRRAITPVQIFQHQHERMRRGEDLQCPGELAQHPPLACPERLALERLALGRGEEAGHLGQPGRRILVEHGAEVGACRTVSEAFQGFEHRHVRFSRPIVLDTLPLPDPDRCPRSQVVQQRLDDGGLANPQLATDQDNLPCPLERLGGPGLELRQLGLAADDGGLAMGGCGTRGTRSARGRRGRQPTRLRGRVARRRALLHRGHKAVAATMHGLDEVLTPPTVTEGPADGRQPLGEGGVPNVLVRPHVLTQFRFCHHAVTMLEEIEQDIEGLGLERLRLPGMAQLIAWQIEGIVVKHVEHGVAFPPADRPCAPAPEPRPSGRGGQR